MREDPVYKAHRIHITPLFSGRWICAIVNMGKTKVTTKYSLTDSVTRLPGEYDSAAEALLAAKQYIDHLEGSR